MYSSKRWTSLYIVMAVSCLQNSDWHIAPQLSCIYRAGKDVNPSVACDMEQSDIFGNITVVVLLVLNHQ